jgi:phosphoribosyl-ATP pyrophosphohydrolase
MITDDKSCDVLERLHTGVRGVDETRFPRTAKLLSGDRGRIAQKLAEEAVEVAIEMIKGERYAVIRESADLLYHLVVLWVAMDVTPGDVWKEIARRERDFGLAEKLPKTPQTSTDADRPLSPG